MKMRIAIYYYFLILHLFLLGGEGAVASPSDLGSFRLVIWKILRQDFY